MIELTKKLKGQKYLVQVSQIIDVAQDNEGSVFVSSTGYEDGIIVAETYEEVKLLIAADTERTKDARLDFVERYCIANPASYLGIFDKMILDANNLYDQIHNIQQ